MLEKSSFVAAGTSEFGKSLSADRPTEPGDHSVLRLLGADLLRAGFRRVHRASEFCGLLCDLPIPASAKQVAQERFPSVPCVADHGLAREDRPDTFCAAPCSEIAIVVREHVSFSTRTVARG